MRYFTLIFSICFFSSFGQNSLTRKVLFIGNSYTYVNNLPQLIADAALSTGDSLIFDSNLIGGSTLQMHSINSISLSKIANGGWDDVVLQEQSQLPSFPIAQVETDVFPYATLLDSLILISNPCAETMFYMTWGRKNGDASNCVNWPPVCTYSGMDSLLRLRYQMMADSNNAVVSPVGAVWKYIRTNYPGIDLYQADESHPSEAGSYAAACCFYATIFRKDPTLITFDFTLSAGDAAIIRNAAKLIAYDSLLVWNIGRYDPAANFTFTNAGAVFNFTNTSTNGITYEWYFGDGDSSIISNPSHQYTTTGNYSVTLIATNCGFSDSTTQQITVNSVGIDYISAQTFFIYPNPFTDQVTFQNNSNNEESLTLQLLDESGRILFHKIINSFERKIEIGQELAEGMYQLQLFDANGFCIFSGALMKN